MKIDISDRIDAAISATSEWAAEAGYRAPFVVQKDALSKRARDVVRILGASEFGCQSRHVKALMEVLLGEKLPETRRGQLNDYANPGVGFRQGVLVVPTDASDQPWNEDLPSRESRPGMVMRMSKSGNAGLRYSSGETKASYCGIQAVRPATEQEIRDYFAEFYGAQFSKFDTIEEPDEAEAIPF